MDNALPPIPVAVRSPGPDLPPPQRPPLVLCGHLEVSRERGTTGGRRLPSALWSPTDEAAAKRTRCLGSPLHSPLLNPCPLLPPKVPEKTPETPGWEQSHVHTHMHMPQRKAELQRLQKNFFVPVLGQRLSFWGRGHRTCAGILAEHRHCTGTS